MSQLGNLVDWIYDDTYDSFYVTFVKAFLWGVIVATFSYGFMSFLTIFNIYPTGC